MQVSWKVWLGGGAAVLALVALKPGLWSAVLPFAVFAACPLAMVLMMKMMSSRSKNTEPNGTEFPDGDSDVSGSNDKATELIQLRAEVERLRNDLAGRPSDDEAGAAIRPASDGER